MQATIATSKRTLAEEESSSNDGHKRQKQPQERPVEPHLSSSGKRKRPEQAERNGHDDLFDGKSEESRLDLHGEHHIERNEERGGKEVEQRHRKQPVNMKAPNKRSIDETSDNKPSTTHTEASSSSHSISTAADSDFRTRAGGDKKSRVSGGSSNLHGSLTPAFEDDLSHLILQSVDLTQWPLDCELHVQRSSQRITSQLLVSRHWEVLWLKAMIGQLVQLNVWEVHLTMHGVLLENAKRLIDYPGAATLEVGCRLKVHLIADEHSDPTTTAPPFVVQSMAANLQIPARQITREEVLCNFGASTSSA